jgi:hypothetical protein
MLTLVVLATLVTRSQKGLAAIISMLCDPFKNNKIKDEITVLHVQKKC